MDDIDNEKVLDTTESTYKDLINSLSWLTGDQSITNNLMVTHIYELLHTRSGSDKLSNFITIYTNIVIELHTEAKETYNADAGTLKLFNSKLNSFILNYIDNNFKDEDLKTFREDLFLKLQLVNGYNQFIENTKKIEKQYKEILNSSRSEEIVKREYTLLNTFNSVDKSLGIPYNPDYPVSS